MKTLEQLRDGWIEAKKLEQNAQSIRKEYEAAIKAHPDFIKSVQEKEFGKRDLAEGFSASISEKRTWDQAHVAAFGKKCAPSDFPFTVSFKEDRKKVRALAEKDPELYAELSKGLSVEPGNPSFSFTEKKEG